MPKLTDRVYIVTGAGGGIGRGICRALLDEGSYVVLTDVDGEGLRDAETELQSSSRTLALDADVTSDDQVARLVEAPVARFGRLDGLVNNAGAITMDASLEATSRDWARQLEVNVTSSWRCARAVAKVLVAGGGGSIVNVASNCGKVGYPNMAAYNASKAAVISLTRSLSQEWAEHAINVNAVCPGGVDTPMLEGVAEWLSARLEVPAAELLESMGPAQLGRKIEPVEVGRVVAFLLSDDALIIRGQSINVDGGDTPY